MFTGAEKYIGRVLNEQGIEFYQDVIDAYGFIPEQCSETSGILIFFDMENYSITDIEARKYTRREAQHAEKLPKEGLRHMDVFIRYITDDPKDK